RESPRWMMHAVPDLHASPSERYGGSVFGCTKIDGSRSIGNAESGCAATHAGSTDSTPRPADPASFACAAATGSPSARTTAGAANDTTDPAPRPDPTAKANDDPARRPLTST